MARKALLSREEREALVGDVVLEVRMHQNAQDAFDDAACDLLGINRTDGRCLDILERRGRITAGELARESGLSSGAVTTLLDRLERKGYVRRIRDTADRRRVLVEFTDEARRRCEPIWAPLGEAGAAGLARMSDEELMVARKFLRWAREVLEEHLERIRSLPAAPAPGDGGRGGRTRRAAGSDAPAEPGPRG